MEYHEFTIRIPKPSRRFSLATLLLAVAVFAVGLYVYVSTARYNVVALLRVVERADVMMSQPYDYRNVQASILQRLQSDEVIHNAIRSATERDIPVDKIRTRLDIQFLGDSEILQISLRGREFRDSKNEFTKIIDSIVRHCVESLGDGTTQVQVIQKPLVH